MKNSTQKLTTTLGRLALTSIIFWDVSLLFRILHV